MNLLRLRNRFHFNDHEPFYKDVEPIPDFDYEPQVAYRNAQFLFITQTVQAQFMAQARAVRTFEEAWAKN